jgi:hypothetical protein
MTLIILKNKEKEQNRTERTSKIHKNRGKCIPILTTFFLTSSTFFSGSALAAGFSVPFFAFLSSPFLSAPFLSPFFSAAFLSTNQHKNPIKAIKSIPFLSAFAFSTLASLTFFGFSGLRARCLRDFFSAGFLS